MFYDIPMKRDSHSPVSVAIDPSWRIGIVHSTYYKEEIEGLIEGAQAVFGAAGFPEDRISLHPVPGSFEIPLIGAALAKAKKVDALIGFGIIVEGETYHAKLLADQVARGIMDVQVQLSTPFAFEVLYVHSLEQARARCFADASKGREAASATLHSLAELKRIFS